MVTVVASASESASVPDAESASLSIFLPFFRLILHRAIFTPIVRRSIRSIGTVTETGLGLSILSTEERKNEPPVKRTMKATKSAEIYSILPNPSGWECVGFLFATLKPTIVTTEESISEALFAASDIIATEPEKKPMTTFTSAIMALAAIPSIAVCFNILLRISFFVISEKSNHLFSIIQGNAILFPCCLHTFLLQRFFLKEKVSYP